MSQKARESAASEGRGGTPPERWSVQQKSEVVLRLLRGEDLGEVSRGMRVSPAELEEWRRVFLEMGRQGLKVRSRDPGERERIRTRANLGELTIVGEPECNGVAERFMRTLKEECLYLHDFQSLEEARQVIAAFIERYNRGWLLERHRYKTPAQVRYELTRKAA